MLQTLRERIPILATWVRCGKRQRRGLFFAGPAPDNVTDPENTKTPTAVEVLAVQLISFDV
ncbi:MAG TPA: hypothetical protein DCX46_00080 [Bacteroidetes bacterium]|nr:hypothetical protein [Bacteroidota bacterium]